MEVPTENTAEISTQVATPAFQFSPIQQWEIAFIYAFSCTFNPQQEIAPNYYKLPDFMPEVNIYNELLLSSSTFIIKHIHTPLF